MDGPDPRWWRLIRPLDYAVAALVLTGALLALPLLAAPMGERADVFVDNRKVARLVLAGPPRTLSVATALGPLTVAYGDGDMRVDRAPCPNKLCIKSGPASRTGGALVCLPARVRVSIAGASGRESGRGSAGEADAVTH